MRIFPVNISINLNQLFIIQYITSFDRIYFGCLTRIWKKTETETWFVFTEKKSIPIIIIYIDNNIDDDDDDYLLDYYWWNEFNNKIDDDDDDDGQLTE